MLTPSAMGPVNLKPSHRCALERQMLDVLLHSMRELLLTVSLVLPALVAWLLLPYVGPVQAVGPAVLILLLSLERLMLLRRVRREWDGTIESTRRWARALAVRVLLAIGVVVLWIHFALQAGDGELISRVLALIAVLAAGAAAQYCCWPPVMWATNTPLLLGLAIQLAALGTTERLIEAGFACILWMVLTMVGLRFGRTLHQNVLNELRNRDLMRDLHEKSVQAEAANAARARFLAAASHDLRQPLQALNLYLSLLQPREQDATTLARLHQCTAALDQLLESLLDLSRMDSGRLVPEPRPFALQPLLEHVASLFEAMAHEKGLQLRVHATSAWSRSDPVLLERALSNLLSNAIRYTERGGVLLGARRRAGGLRLCVYDTGIGIHAEAQASIFEEFVQLDNPQRDPARGYGLGLATVQRTAQILAHPLQMRSVPGRGSCFMLDIPIALPQPARCASVQTQPAAGQLQGRVLVVEDNLVVREALVQLLRGWSLQVHAVPDGEQACAAMTEAAFDAVLSDWRLPGGMDGIAVLRHAQAVLPELRLGLLLTGEDTQRLQDLHLEFPVLRKPVRPLRLRALLGPALASSGWCATKRPAVNRRPMGGKPVRSGHGASRRGAAAR
ncbi:hybrid sensor histidine kinase/response regulator [Castellaniella sp.]|uniref:ATP-binding response regulator n=1 Tax=Castellaniella sp. TaxID=1955812 RepID=UPI00356185C2